MARLTVTAVNASRCLGQANPSFALSYSGFRFSDNENSLAGRPQVATSATASSAAGSYPITVSGGSSANYTLVYAGGTLRVDALPNITITPSGQGAIGRGLTLQLSATGGNSYSWASAQGIISGQNSAVLTIRPTTSTTYTVTVANANGCSSTASYAITVVDDLSILRATNILSPNGDGVNDVWKVANIDMYPQAVVRIFDRAGRIVYTRKGYDNSWDGTYNGQPLAESTYYYIIDLEAGKVLRGYITLVRDR
ncbi:gliding motility-associated C-terminal domain-containing protein [Pedobacter sp. ASV28]|uniref:T9SS type B sorting domain-containing protein n=1 Tax=Pedobacter sp. ASV28 TaxID=2795123 RepID=UPI001E38437A|nr:gliding motility-associated C-terminal domain-containing protein [Pedobacter sp. ASV28]